MKKFLFIICLALVSFSGFSQRTFDKSLKEISADISEKLNSKNKKKVVVLYITDINKSQTVAGIYIADIVSVNIVNNSGNFEVFDRENLSGIAEAKKMIAEGYIDATNAKELGRLLSVEAIVIGNYTVLSTTLKLTLKALDVNSGLVIAATMQDLLIDEDAKALLGISGTSENNVNKGFNNRPLNSNESYNNPETVNKDCEKNNTGDYCFSNNTNINIQVVLSVIGDYGYYHDKKITLKPGQTQCYYDLPCGPIRYYFENNDVNINKTFAKGQINVEKCKSKTFIIK
jgi:hypothetical protein